MRRNSFFSVALWLPTMALVAVAASDTNQDPLRIIQSPSGQTRLTLADGAVVHSSANLLRFARRVSAPDSGVSVILWQEETPQRGPETRYAVSFDGTSYSRALRTTHRIKLRFADYDPRIDAPSVPAALQADAASRLYIVQFIVQPLEAFQTALRERGAIIHGFLPDNAVIVSMGPAAREGVARLAFVRWVGRFHPAYKLDEAILSEHASGVRSSGPRDYSIQAFVRGPAPQREIAERIVKLGGAVINTTPDGFRMTAALTFDQVLDIARMDEVQFIDSWGPGELDMDIAREIGGANYIEAQGGFTGQGVRGEIFDTEVDPNHPEWRCPPTPHCSGSSGSSHGTGTYGILFAQGLNPQARGLLPDGCGIFCFYLASTQFGGSTSRLQLNREATDPNGPYRSVFQTSGVGSPRTRNYTTISAEVDDYLFQVDYLSCQATGNDPLIAQGRPQAWAKNIVSVGGVIHQNTLTRVDDTAAGSVGPAPDGRVKPDLIHFYDNVFTTGAGGGYTQFGGTSGSTPIVAGHFGLLFQMWHEGVFPGHGGGASVFDSRCKSTTARALLINTAFRYDWTQGGPNGNLTRMHQGWGMPDVGKLYDLRRKLFVVDETDLLVPLGENQYTLNVSAGEPELLATLVYIDPPGIPMATQQRINDLTLKLTSPSGVVYWGNNGLMDGNYSTPGGSANTLDVVENVFLEDPEPGEWRVEVLGDEIVQDSHVETPQLDADYALVVSGVTLGCVGDLNGDGATDLADLGILLADFGCLPPPNCVGDLDNDGDTDLADLGILLADFGCAP